MIPCWNHPDRGWEPIQSNPTLTRLDGEQRARLSVIMHRSWTWPERWLWGVFEMKSAEVPEGFRAVGEIFTFDPTDSKVNRGYVLEKLLPVDITVERIPGKGNAIRHRRTQQTSGS